MLISDMIIQLGRLKDEHGDLLLFINAYNESVGIMTDELSLKVSHGEFSSMCFICGNGERAGSYARQTEQQDRSL